MNAASTVADGEMLQTRAQTMLVILSFLALAFAWSWGLGWAAAQLTAPLSLGRMALTVASGFGPSLAGFAAVVMFSTSAGPRDWIAGCLNWRVGGRWFAFAFLVPPSVMLFALAINVIAGEAMPAITALDHFPLTVLNFSLILFIGGPLGEEFGWRGYAMPALTVILNWHTASLVIGIMWGLWHLLLFFMIGTSQSQMAIPVFMLNILTGSILFGWLFERTQQSVLPAIVMHTSLNAWAGILMIVPTAASGIPYAIVTGLLVLIAAVLLIAPDLKQLPKSC